MRNGEISRALQMVKLLKYRRIRLQGAVLITDVAFASAPN